jgi:formate/nitrite transporter FocA (FNT family)
VLDEEAPPLWRLVLAVVLGLLAGLTLEMLSLALVAVVRHLAGDVSNTLATILLDAASAGAWLVAGGVGYEAGRSRVATIAVASLPPLAGLALALGLVVGERQGYGGRLVGALVFGLALGACAYLGGRLWERHIRRAGAVQSQG